MSKLKHFISSFYAGSLGLVIAFDASASNFDKEKIIQNLKSADVKSKKIQADLDTTVLTSGETMLLAVAVIAFTWVSYSAVAKFRECQKGMADWSEMIVLGVAAAALLFLVSLLISNAAGLLTSTA